jgi:hypothetical protein
VTPKSARKTETTQRLQHRENCSAHKPSRPLVQEIGTSLWQFVSELLRRFCDNSPMKNRILVAIFSWTIFPSLALAAEPSAQKVGDLLWLKKTLHGASQAQLEQRYQIYNDQMTSYLTDLPSCINIWMNVNEIKRKKIQAPAEFSPGTLESEADKAMTEHIATARTARQNLVKITSVEALLPVPQIIPQLTQVITGIISRFRDPLPVQVMALLTAPIANSRT